MNEKKDKWQTIHTTKVYKELKENIVKQLVDEGKNTLQNIDLVGKYMEFWIIHERLKEDIKERGVAVDYYTPKGDVNTKKNENIAEMVKINSQMLNILKQFNLKNEVSSEDDEL